VQAAAIALRELKTPPDHLKDTTVAVQVSVPGDRSDVVESCRQATKGIGG